MKVVRYLVTTAILLALWAAYIFGAGWIWPRLGEYAVFEKAIALIVPSLVMIGFTAGWLERFYPLRGRLMAIFGTILMTISGRSGFGRSLVKLRDWHDKGETGEDFVEYCRQLEPAQLTEFKRKNPFSQWMITEIVGKYENNVQGLAYLGAGILILFIGLRGLQIIGRNDPIFIVLPLEIEFTIIGLLGLLVFYKPEEGSRIKVDLSRVLPTQEIESLTKEVRETRQELSGDRTLEVHIRRSKS